MPEPGSHSKFAVWLAKDVSVELHPRKIKVRHLEDDSVVALGFDSHNAARKAYRRFIRVNELITIRPQGWVIEIIPEGRVTGIVMSVTL